MACPGPWHRALLQSTCLQGTDTDEVQCYCAIGSGDKAFSVWSLAEQQAVLVGQRFFDGGGYVFGCSTS